MTNRKHATGFGPAGWDRGDAMPYGLEYEPPEPPERILAVLLCEDCGSDAPKTRYVIERMDGKGPLECDNAFHGKRP